MPKSKSSEIKAELVESENTISINYKTKIGRIQFLYQKSSNSVNVFIDGKLKRLDDLPAEMLPDYEDMVAFLTRYVHEFKDEELQ